jgi:small-conductance mechanosensitive channel
MVQQEWFSGIREVSDTVAAFLPTLLGAALLGLAGWLLGRFLGWVARRLVRAFVTQLAKRPALQTAIESSATATQLPGVIGGFAFWVVFLFFVAVAMETLGLPVVTASLNRVAYYLPNVLAALVTVFAGVVAGKVIGGAVTRAAATTGMALGPTIGATVRSTVILVAVVVAMEQVGIQADVLIVVVAVVVGATLAGAGLAFGLGARTAVSNIIAAHYVAQAYRVGQTIRVAGVDGKIVQTTPTAVFIAGPEGRVMIPAKQFSEETSVLLTESSG